jgi:hypothetical protein
MSVFLVGIRVYTVPTSPGTRPPSASALPSLCRSSHLFCSPAWYRPPFPLALYSCTLLYVKRWENAARVRVDGLRGSPKSHLLSHLATIGIGRSSGRGPGQHFASPPPRDFASPLTRVVFHVAIPHIPDQLTYRKHSQSCIIAQSHLPQSLTCLHALL